MMLIAIYKTTSITPDNKYYVLYMHEHNSNLCNKHLYNVEGIIYKTQCDHS